MEVLERMLRGIARTTGILGYFAHQPRMLLFPAVGLVLLIYRSQTKAPERREFHKDITTLVGMFTWRPVWQWRTPVGGLVVALWLDGHGYGAVLLAAVAVLAGTRIVAPAAWEKLAVFERCHQWQWRWRTRWLWACLVSDTLGRERWGVANPYPVAKKVELNGDNAVLTVRVPPKLDVAALQANAGILGARLKVKGVAISPTQNMGYARVEVLNRGLAPGRRLERIEAPADERYLTVGYGHAGPVHWDLDNEVGIGIFGATGAGKGVLARWVACQALDPRHARELWIVDPQGSAEWTVFEGLPGVRLLAYDPAHPAASLLVIEHALDELAVDVAHRNALCAAEDVDSWRYLDPAIKAALPRRLLLIDEVTSLVGKVETADSTRKLRESIGAKIGTSYRTVRKAGVGFLHVDQASYQGSSTYLADGSIAQLGRWLALGGMRDETRRMISGYVDWPYTASMPGLGLTGRRADPNPQPIEVPDVTRAQVADTLHAWHTARTSVPT